MIGKTISHYRVIEKIGEGGMGVVYLAEHTLLGRRVAIKTLIVGGSENQHFRSRFLREAQAVSKLSHPNIANIYDYGETDDGQPYIVMELVEGKTLNEVMRAETLTIARAIDVVTQVAQALSEAHRHGIVHRDIKPSNIAINERGVVKVLDFGLAKHAPSAAVSAESNHSSAAHTQTREGVIVGTPLYLSPEQALGLEVDARSDLFSLGSVLYECIAGRPAFAGKSDIDICAKVIRDDPPPPSQFNPDVSSELDQIALKALAKKPEARYQTAVEMVAAIDSCQNEPLTNGSRRTVTRLISAVPGTQGTSALATLSDIFKRPRLSVGYVAAGLLIVGVLIFGAWYFTRARPHKPTVEAQRLYDRAVEAMHEGAFFRASKTFQQAIQEDPDFALAHARLAEASNELDSSETAIGELLRAKELVPDSAILSQLDGLKFQAVTDTVKRDFGKALTEYQTLVSMVPANEKPFALVDLGRAYEKNEQTDKAIQTYQEAIKLDPHQAPAFLRAGVLLGRRGRLGEAYTSLDQAYKLFDIESDIEGLIEVRLQRAVIMAQEGKVANARAELQQGLQKSEALESKDKQIKVLLNLSNTEIIAGNPDQAQQSASQAVELARSNGLDNLTMQGIIDIGNKYLQKGNFLEAEKDFNEALRLAQLYKGKRSEARALLSLSSLRCQQGDATGARNFFQRALPFYEQGGYRKEISQAYAILGRVQESVGDYETATQTNQKLLELAEQQGDQQSLALAHENLGLVLMDLQRFPDALKHLDENFRIVKSLNASLSAGYTANNRASALWQIGDYEGAKANLKEALEIAQPQGHEPNTELLALVYLTRSRMELSRRDVNALPDAKKVLEVAGQQYKSITIRANYTLGLAEARSGHPQLGLKHCEEAVQMARVLGDPFHLSSSLLALAETSFLAGDARAASAAASEAQQRFAAAKQHESEWRALLIEAEAKRRFGDKSSATQLALQANEVFASLKSEWGAEPYDSYLKRGDIDDQRRTLNALLVLT